jgi:ribosome recycling factor
VTDRAKADEARAAIADRLMEAELRMEKSLEALHKELMTVRTGRASPALLERLQVDYFGAPTPLQSLAGIKAPEPRLLVVQPYDKSAIAAIEKAIQKSELGLNPSNDGQVIRLVIPALTEESRRDLVKTVHRKAEDARVSVRNIRRDEVEHLRKVEKEGHVSKDEVERNIDELQKLTDQFTAKVDDAVQKKETAILEV